MAFNHENLNVYQRMLPFNVKVGIWTGEWDSKHAICDQLSRAAGSMLENAAMASAAYSSMKHRALNYAIGSSLECAASLDLACIKRLLNAKVVYTEKEELSQILRMLVGLRKSWVSTAHGVGEGSAEYSTPGEGIDKVCDKGARKMNIEHVRIWTARVLLGFVLITVGFSLGRHTAPEAGNSMPTPSQESVGGTEPVVVYAAHMTFRCPECNQIEWFARELIETEFADALADGRLVFRSVDYMRDTAFARRYNISSSTIVVTRADSDDFQRLDEVWTKVRNREEYFAYVRAAIRKSLGQEDDV